MESSRFVVYGAIAANLFIAFTKFGAAYLTGSSVMISEGIHSVVDAGNDSLLLLGIHLSMRPPDQDHPLGHGREIYFWGLIVALILFGIGGVLSILEGVRHLSAPRHVVNAGVAYATLGTAAAFETGSFIIGLRELSRGRGQETLWQAVLSSKDPSVFVVVFEDAAALAGLTVAFAGVFLSHFLSTPVIDGMASVLIGVILAAVSVFLCYQTRGLLIGESASTATIKGILSVAGQDPAVLLAHKPFAVHLGPHEIILALDVHFRKGLSAADLALAIDRVEKAIQASHPDVKRIFIEAGALVEETVRAT
jgi:cation diffusion facilitator family transporter